MTDAAGGAASPTLTVHVLDLTRGRPAAGMALALARVGGADGPTVVVRTTTDADGRTPAPLLSGAELRPGRYELTYAVGDYSAAGDPATPTGAEPYLDEVPIRFGVTAADDHVHVALLVTPWSYTTYRGS